MISRFNSSDEATPGISPGMSFVFLYFCLIISDKTPFLFEKLVRPWMIPYNKIYECRSSVTGSMTIRWFLAIGSINVPLYLYKIVRSSIDILLNIVFEKTDSDERNHTKQFRQSVAVNQNVKIGTGLLRDWIPSWPTLDPDTGQRKALSATEKSD